MIRGLSDLKTGVSPCLKREKSVSIPLKYTKKRKKMHFYAKKLILGVDISEKIVKDRRRRVWNPS